MRGIFSGALRNDNENRLSFLSGALEVSGETGEGGGRGEGVADGFDEGFGAEGFAKYGGVVEVACGVLSLGVFVGGGEDDSNVGTGLEQFLDKFGARCVFERDIDEEEGDAVGVVGPDGFGSFRICGFKDVEAACLQKA